MLFEELVTPAEKRQGYVHVSILETRSLASASYNVLKAEEGGSIREAAIAIGDEKHELELIYVPRDPDSSGVYWVSPRMSRNPETYFYGEKLEDFVPVSAKALVAALSSAFGLCPDMVAREAVDLQAYWAGEGISDESLPPAHLVSKYLLLPKT